MKRIASALLLAALLVASGPIGAQPDNDKQAIQGIWTVVSQRKGEGGSAPSETKEMKVVIDAKRLVIVSVEPAKGGGTYEFKQELAYTLNSSQSPKAIDLGSLAFRDTKDGKADKGPEVVETWPGIYELNEDSLKIAFDEGRGAKKKGDGSFEDKGISANRPKNFDGGPSVSVFTLKRQKKV